MYVCVCVCVCVCEQCDLPMRWFPEGLQGSSSAEHPSLPRTTSRAESLLRVGCVPDPAPPESWGSEAELKHRGKHTGRKYTLMTASQQMDPVKAAVINVHEA